MAQNQKPQPLTVDELHQRLEGLEGKSKDDLMAELNIIVYALEQRGFPASQEPDVIKSQEETRKKIAKVALKLNVMDPEVAKELIVLKKLADRKLTEAQQSPQEAAPAPTRSPDVFRIKQDPATGSFTISFPLVSQEIEIGTDDKLAADVYNFADDLKAKGAAVYTIYEKVDEYVKNKVAAAAGASVTATAAAPKIDPATFADAPWIDKVVFTTAEDGTVTFDEKQALAAKAAWEASNKTRAPGPAPAAPVVAPAATAQSAAPAATAQPAAPDNVIPFPGGGKAGAAAPTAASAPTGAPPSAPSVAPDRTTQVDEFLNRMLENEEDRYGAIGGILERKLSDPKIDLVALGSFIGAPTQLLSVEARTHVDANKSTYQLEAEIKGKTDEVEAAKEALDNARAFAGNIRATEKVQENVMQAQRELTKAKKELRALQDALGFLGKSRTYKPRELLLMVNYFLSPKETKTNIARRTDIEVDQTLRGADARWYEKNGFVLGLLRPTLKETLKGLHKATELSHVPEEKLAELANIDTVAALKKWIAGLEGSEANYSTTVPALIAYLRAAMVDETGNTKVNSLSRGHFEKLVNNLRYARNTYLTAKVDKENPGATNQEKMLKYFAALNESDEMSVSVDHQLLSDIATKSYMKAGVKLAAAPIAAWYVVPMIGFGAVASALSFLGWGNVAAATAYLGVRSKIEHVPHKYRQTVKSIAPRILGLTVLGPAGLFAPELFRAAAWIFRHREKIKKGAETTAGVTGKVVTAPFRGAKAIKNAFTGKGKGSLPPATAAAPAAEPEKKAA